MNIECGSSGTINYKAKCSNHFSYANWIGFDFSDEIHIIRTEFENPLKSENKRKMCKLIDLVNITDTQPMKHNWNQCRSHDLLWVAFKNYAITTKQNFFACRNFLSKLAFFCTQIAWPQYSHKKCALNVAIKWVNSVILNTCALENVIVASK